ncbi:PLDc N-terminal domain-containing protein [Prescottella subtropica]|uniref:PLDc N-terminal domain-containing protein n=1 Tax=Prescottella subtropica TaxID=2545757 RepID=UPI0010F902E8|nr:PLDc N-terminal domain-containing protein [Prescottella subtropica]
MATTKWAELSTAQRGVIAVLGSVQVVLAVSAWADLARRPREQINGRKGKWAAIIGVNVFGPLSYFRWGRRKSA